MSIEILYNPAVIGAIIGAIVGAVASASFAIITSQYKFNKRKKGALALIKSETTYIVDALEEFRNKFLNEEIKIKENEMDWEVFNFYNKMANYPIWSNINWINLISFIPSIFNEEEINKINYFYLKCEEVTDNAKALADKEPYDEYCIEGEQPKKIPRDLNVINSHRNMFRNDLNELIQLGIEVKRIFK